MKRLLLLRHAKSARPAGVLDHERPLERRGFEDSRVMGAYLRQEMLLPDLVLVSTSNRTRQTWDVVIQGLGGVPSASFEPRLYDAPAARLAKVIGETAQTVRSLMLIGHNPGLHELAVALADENSPTFRALASGKFPTAACVSFRVPADWSALGSSRHELIGYVAPDSLADEDP